MHDQQRELKTVLVQSSLRSYLASKKANKLKKSAAMHSNQEYNRTKDTGLVGEASPADQENEYEIMGEGEHGTIDESAYYNEKVEQIAEILGPFDYGQPEDDMNVEREMRDPVLFKNGSKYEGEWNTSSNERDGRGVQVWADGSIYEGYWKNDRANGRGRLIHSDGDVYEGEWVDDK
jgi:hypothetical protein